MKRKIDTVLFDFDGTIMNTTPVIMNSWRRVFRMLKDEELDEELIYPTMGEPLVDSLKKLFPETPTEVSMEIYRSYQRENFVEEIELFPGMKEAVIAVREAGCKTGLVTSRLKQTTYKGLEAFGLLELMDTVVTVEDTEKHKPDPEPVLAALQALGSLPENTLMLGDTHFDIACANNAGVTSVLVAWSDSMDPANPPADAVPDLVLHEAGELVTFL